MIRVLTYGTFDLFHHGHLRLLERAKSLGDYLIVGVTSDDYDMSRGKINVSQSLIERIENIKATGLADEIIVEEYDGQKIDDIQRLNIDVFAIGSDWQGKFDYLMEYCKVVYLDRTQGISSSKLRDENRKIRLGLVGNTSILEKFYKESGYVNGIYVSAICTRDINSLPNFLKQIDLVTDDYSELLENVDAVYLSSPPQKHAAQIKEALQKGIHVLCESPLTINLEDFHEAIKMAEEKGLILEEANKTAYSTAYWRLVLMAKMGKIGKVMSIDATCTSLTDNNYFNDDEYKWNSISSWGSKAMLPIFQILGTDYKSKNIITHIVDEEFKYDSFTKINFLYENAVASVKVGKGVKSEGDLIISGTEGYIYVPSPWWKTDYFEIRYEKLSDNKRFYYQLEGEGIRNQIVSFIISIQKSKGTYKISKKISEGIVKVMDDFYSDREITHI